MESPTLDALLEGKATREAVHTAREGLGMSDLVIRYAFWHLDEKRNGRLSGHVDGSVAWTSPLQFVEMVVEQAQTDLLAGAARKHRSAELKLIRQSNALRARAPVISKVQQLARRQLSNNIRAALPPRTRRQDIASKWKTVTARRTVLAEDSADWKPSRVSAMQKSIANALTAWQTCVNLPDET